MKLNNIWKKTYPWVYKGHHRLLISLGFGVLIIFIILFLKPFDTGEKYLPYKNLMLSGYGICIILTDCLLAFAERFWVLKRKRHWTFGSESVYLLALFIVAAIAIYVYDLVITKQSSVTWHYLPTYTYKFILPFALLLLPLLAYIRFSVGKKIYPESLSRKRITFSGQNKEDYLELEKHQLLYLKAEDNYVRIFYTSETNTLETQLMRNTLSNMNEQVQGLKATHRSYLIAPWQIRKIKGNRQKASVKLQNCDEEIPLTSTYYPAIKSFLKS